MIKFQACLCLYQTISTISNSDLVVFFWLEIYTDEIYQYFLWLEKKSATKKVGLKSLTMKSTGKFDLQKFSKTIENMYCFNTVIILRNDDSIDRYILPRTTVFHYSIPPLL